MLDTDDQGSDYPQLASVVPKTATVNDLVLSTPNDGELSEGILTTSTLRERRKVSFEKLVAELRSIVAECQQEADDIETESYGASILDVNNQGSKYPQLVSDATNTPATKGETSTSYYMRSEELSEKSLQDLASRTLEVHIHVQILPKNLKNAQLKN